MEGAPGVVGGVRSSGCLLDDELRRRETLRLRRLLEKRDLKKPLPSFFFCLLSPSRTMIHCATCGRCQNGRCGGVGGSGGGGVGG